MDALNAVTSIYNKTRNYLSGKIYTTEKVKLTFGSSLLLDGWAESVESAKLGTLLLKDGKYYLQSGSMKAYHTLAKCKGKWYLYGSKGARLSGLRKFNGKQYYFTPERATGFKMINGAKYYFIDKKYKYYKEANEGAMAVGFKIINNKM